MSHNHTHFVNRIIVATAVVAMGLVMAPTGAHASTGVVAASSATAKTAPGQPAFGDKGPHVVAVQAAIMRNGFTLKGGATGVFNKSTQRALKTFQKVVGLKATGVVDTATAKVLKVSEATTTTVQATTTTVAPTTTTSTTTSSTTTTTTQPAPITVPKANLSDDFSGQRRSSGLMLGLGGLSGAVILGTAPWRKLGTRRRKVVS
jgi:peptidoglycan hydrolase-like protein with peptidoglycan-binding domain